MFWRYFRKIPKKTRERILFIIAVLSLVIEFLVFNPFTNIFFISLIADWLSKVWR